MAAQPAVDAAGVSPVPAHMRQVCCGHWLHHERAVARPNDDADADDTEPHARLHDATRAKATRAEACGVGLRRRLGHAYRSPWKQIIGQLQMMSSIRQSGISICIVSRRGDRGGGNSGAKTRRESPDDEHARGEHKGLQSWRTADGSRPNTRRSTSGVHGGTPVWTPAASTRRSSAPTAW